MINIIIIFIIIILLNIKKNNDKIKEEFLFTKYLTYQKLQNRISKINYIPKIIYQTYHDKSKIPQKVVDNINKYAFDYDYKLFDDNDCIEFLKKNYNYRIVNIFKKLKRGAHKADLFRYCILYLKGGIYLDVKTNLIKPLNQIFTNNYTYSVLSVFNNTVYQGIIATKPGNPLFLKLINDFIDLKSYNVKEYLLFTRLFYRKVKNDVKNIIPGFNKNYNNDYNYYFFYEKCFNNSAKCYDGFDRYNKCCYICDKGKEIIKTRYSDYPW